MRSSLGQCSEYALDAALFVAEKLVLPNSNNLPAKRAKLSKVTFVSFAVGTKLLSPERRQFSFPGWQPPTMPEIAIDEDGDLTARENDVRTSW
jgi:hypothetical protein